MHNICGVQILSCCSRCYPACSACKQGLSELVQQLLEAGHDVNSTTADSQLTPLHIASKHGHEHVLRLLLQQPGVDVDAETAADVQVGGGLELSRQGWLAGQ